MSAQNSKLRRWTRLSSGLVHDEYYESRRQTKTLIYAREDRRKRGDKRTAALSVLGTAMIWSWELGFAVADMKRQTCCAWALRLVGLETRHSVCGEAHLDSFSTLGMS